MSGHSHAKTIKHQKDITDKKRGQVFSKMARVISVAVKEGGPNQESNSRLRLALEQAKNFNMPKENVERAVKKASGGDGEEKLEEVSFEAYGPGGIAMIIEGITDNKNRALGEVKQVLSQHQGKMVGEGAVRWMFEKRGVITIQATAQEKPLAKEEMELLAIEAGAQDIYWYDENLDIYTKPEDLEKAKKILEEKGVKIDSASPDWVPKEEISLDERTKESYQKLFEALDELESVQDVYANLKI